MAPNVAVNWQHISFLVAARGLGASYERTLMIGRQNLYATPKEIVLGYEDAGQKLDLSAARAIVREGDGYVEPLFRRLGGRQIDALDVSDYEQSSVIADLNEPLAEDLRGRYSVVFDGGSLEHVFNFPTAFKSCLQAVQPGGHFITVTETNGFSGHGFYQLSPELFYRALSPQNGFEVKVLLTRPTQRRAKWMAVADPAKVGGRVELASPWQTLMYVLAKRISDAEPFAVWPQQSDYRPFWAGQNPTPPGRARFRLVARLPKPVRDVVMEARNSTALLGKTSGPHHFTPVRMADVAGGSLSGP